MKIPSLSVLTLLHRATEEHTDVAFGVNSVCEQNRTNTQVPFIRSVCVCIVNFIN